MTDQQKIDAVPATPPQEIIPVDDFTDYDNLVPELGTNVSVYDDGTDTDAEGLVPPSLRGDDTIADGDDTENTIEEGVTGEDDTGQPAPALLAGKYKTVEEMEKGYKELEAEFTRRNQQQAQQPTQVEPVNENGETFDQQYARLGNEYQERFSELKQENWSDEEASTMAWAEVKKIDDKVQKTVNEALKRAMPQMYQNLGVDIIGKEITSFVPQDARITTEAMKTELQKAFVGINEAVWAGFNPLAKQQAAIIAQRMAVATYLETKTSGKARTPDVAPTNVASGGAPSLKSTNVSQEIMGYARQLANNTGQSLDWAIKSITKNSEEMKKSGKR